MKEIKEVLKNNCIFLAPLAGVTDVTFRALCKSMGAGLTFTEMVSAKGLHFRSKNTAALVKISEEEGSAAVQIFGCEPQIMAEQAAKLAEDERVILIDINMGCPAPKITGNGEGSALMKNPELAGQIVKSVSSATKKPISVKFRKGWDERSVNAVDFAKRMEQEGAAMLSVHGRTREQQYSGKADWDIIAKVKESVGVPVIGNGDVHSPGDAFKMIEQTGCDGVMVARGALGNPWIFKNIAALASGRPLYEPSPEERVKMALYHAKRLMEEKGDRAVIEMRKHIAWYMTDCYGAAKVRAEVNGCASFEELEHILNNYLQSKGMTAHGYAP